MLKNMLYSWDFIDEALTSSIRQNELNKIMYSKDEVSQFIYHTYDSEHVLQEYEGLEFRVTPSIIRFAYNIAYWKFPYVLDKANFPSRTDYERFSDIFVGVVSEVLSYLYFKQIMGINEISYYDVVRLSPRQNNALEYDLRLYDKYMSLKLTKCVPIQFEGNFIPANYLLIKGTPGSDDRYYTQFIMPQHQYGKNIVSLLHECLNDNKYLPFNFYFIAGYVRKDILVWGSHKKIVPGLDYKSYIDEIKLDLGI